MSNPGPGPVNGLGAAALAVILAFAAAPTMAAQIEDPPTASAATILGAQSRGANYEIDNPVRSDGFLYIFSLKTPDGRFQIEGRDMLNVRLRELGAITALERMDKSQAYVDAAAKAAKKPVDLAVGLVSNPIGTVQQSMSGVGALFSRIGASANNMGKSRDNTADSLLGVSSAKRQLAARLGVDPYTDFKPLADKLEDMARVIALGDLTVSGAYMAIPGGAGMAVGYSKTAQDAGQWVLDKTAAELRDANRAKLAAMGVPASVVGAFLDNKFYTPLDQTIIVTALGKMTGVANRNLFVARAAQAPNRDLAFFVRRRAELTAEHHLRVEPFSEFVMFRGFPFNRTRSGKIVMVVGLDHLIWTRQASDMVAVIDQDIKQGKPGTVVEIRLTGTASERAKEGLRERGWKLFENVSL
jgi:hypothetical protein